MRAWARRAMDFAGAWAEKTRTTAIWTALRSSICARNDGRERMRFVFGRGAFPVAGVCLLSVALGARAKTQTPTQRPSAKELHDAAGDIATDPGPIDTSLSPKLTRADVRKA